MLRSWNQPVLRNVGLLIETTGAFDVVRTHDGPITSTTGITCNLNTGTLALCFGINIFNLLCEFYHTLTIYKQSHKPAQSPPPFLLVVVENRYVYKQKEQQ